MVRPYDPGFESARRRGRFRRRTLAVLVGLSVVLIAGGLALSLGLVPWIASHRAAGLDDAPAGPSAASRSITSSELVIRQRLAAAGRMLAAGDLHGAQHEYLMILLTVAPDSAQAWRGLAMLHRRWAAENPTQLQRQANAYRLAIRNGTEMDEHYSPQALAVLAKAAMLAAREIEGARRRLEVAASRTMLDQRASIVHFARAVFVAPVQRHWPPIEAYVISVGDFANPIMADRLMHLIRSKGYIVDVARRGPVSQVVTPPYRTRRQAEYVVDALGRLGLPAKLVARRLPPLQ
jgi:hypothetical protein